MPYKEVPPLKPEPRRLTEDPDGGFYADDISHSGEPEVYGVIPTVREGEPFTRPSQQIAIGGTEIVDLPEELRVKEEVIDQGLDGELHARPATLSEWGGGLRVAKTKKQLPRTHHKSSHQIKIFHK